MLARRSLRHMARVLRNIIVGHVIVGHVIVVAAPLPANSPRDRGETAV
ncbi:MAG TPA: hypothetical protein VGR45_17040 [Stellaceae bacterium]|nr:hypothetical protein [Stellaceae bacterium]